MHPSQNESAANQDKQDVSSASAGGNRQLRILVVEDNRNLKDMLCDMLELLGHAAQGAADAEEAIALSEQHIFDVLLTDVSLPGISGIALAKQLLVKQPGLHVVFASGYGVQMVQHIKFKSRVLPKPYDVEQIQQLLAELSSLA
ncbi:response regulator [Undibacterium sp.]|jgi:CheY-like chemotaxis protein|uniref:response regulator n=1 Tax=Undibacterium sp. TaxID=1914977 RepID=UPI002C96BBB5|nr:response regulator [Undibacterium sp.]HTD06691.1 response regulator [Undibacterium sp.]